MMGLEMAVLGSMDMSVEVEAVVLLSVEMSTGVETEDERGYSAHVLNAKNLASCWRYCERKGS